MYNFLSGKQTNVILLIQFSVLLIFFFFLSDNAFSQKGTWQVALEKKQQQISYNRLEERLVLACAIAQEVKEYDLSQAFEIAIKALREAQKNKLPRAEAEAYNAIAEVYRLRGKPLEAIGYQNKAFQIFQKMGIESHLQRVERDRAFAYSGLSKFDSTQRVLEKVLIWYEKNEPHTREHAITLQNLGVNTLRLGRYEEAMQYSKKAEKIFKRLADSHSLMRIKNNMGLIQKNMGHYNEALLLYTTALKGYEKAGENQRATVIVLSNLGNMYAHLRDTTYNKQIYNYYDRAYQIALRIKDTIQIISCIELLAKGEAMQKKFEKAKKYYQEGYQLIQNTNNYLEEGYYMLRIADIYLWAGEIETAISTTEKALRIFENKKTIEAIAQAQAKLASFYRSKKAYQTSQQYAFYALKSAEKSDYNSIPYLHMVLINNAIDLQRFQEAEQWGQQAIIHFERVKGVSSLLDIYKTLIRLDTIQKNDARAAKWYARYNVLYDSLYVLNKNRNMLELQFKYDVQAQQRENEYLKKINLVQQLETQERGVIIFAISLFLICMFFVAAFLYYNKQRLTKLLEVVREKSQAIVEKNHEIEAQNESLEKLNLTKDRILSVISHDMRSPLANLKAVLDLANTGVISLEEKVSLTQKLNKDIGRVYDFLQNLLLWAESQMGGFTPSVEKIILSLCIENVLSIVENQANQKSIKLSNITDNNLVLHTDKDILSIVLLNLISNAIKFTPHEGEIQITILKEPNKVKISVKDNGVGIAPQHYDKIFGQTRFTTNGTAEEKGTGFGLSLCRDFMKVLGGDLYFESELRKGTTFFVEVPDLPED